MKIKVFYPDRNGNIVFTKKELEDLLDEVYREGYNDARPYYWTTPYWTSNSGTITTGSPLRGDNITYSVNDTNSYNNTYTTAKDVPSTYTDSEITNVSIDLSNLEYSKHSVKYE